MKKIKDRKIVLEDGSEYYGYGFGDTCDKVCEIVFNTSMFGYQEIISEPSYLYQAVVLTYPLIGNCGIADDDFDAKSLTADCLIVREYNDQPSNFQYTRTLSEVMAEYHIPGLYGIDTRKLTRDIRDNGSRKVMITNADTPKEKALEIIKNTVIPTDGVSRVSTKKRWYTRVANAQFNVIAVDCGIKLNVVKALSARGCNVTVVPYNIPAEEVERINPDGILLSDGPGDPVDAEPVIELVRKLKGKYPMFGIGLGHQVIGLAYGAKSDKLKYGHRGDNHPVKNTATGNIEITSQNHSYLVNEGSLEGTQLKITHRSLMDNTVEGIECDADGVFSVQFTPECAKNTVDKECLFDKFIDIMKSRKN